MPKPQRPPRQQFPVQGSDLSIVVCDDGSRTLRCTRRNITWHSESGALAESKLVFLQNSGIADRLRRGDGARVLEIGFGTGLNFLLTASLALQSGTELMYHAFEPNLLPQHVLEMLEYQSLESCRLAMESFFPLQRDSHVDGVSLRLIDQQIEQLDFASVASTFDAVFHDAFSPEAAPELWDEALFRNLHATLKNGGKLVTYCVKSEIQRRFRAAGFTVSKTRGPAGGKREVLIATK